MYEWSENSSKANRQMRLSDFAYRIVSFSVIDRPGMVCIEVLKDRTTGKTGIKIVEAQSLIGRTLHSGE